jgi:hypothetical protein
MLNEFEIENENIFYCWFFGVAMAKKNTQVLADKIYLATTRTRFLLMQKQRKMLLKGCVPPQEYPKSVILDIGGGNTKGGYVDVQTMMFFCFFH